MVPKPGSVPEQPITPTYDHLPADIDLQNGLTSTQVESARSQWGPNSIPTPKVPAYMIFIRQFTGFLPLLIAAAAFISLAVEGE